jgi:hypothetical protein
MNVLSRWYQIRIVNVNVNIIVAGLLALVPTAIAAHLVQDVLGIHHGLAIAAITFLVDAVADVGVYYVLHWLANHMPRSQPRRETSAAYGHLPYLHDATLAQFQRMCLSPILYVIALGGQYTLHRGYDVSLMSATAVSFTAGILATRLLHTIWMLRAERRARAIQQEKPADAPHAPAGTR